MISRVFGLTALLMMPGVFLLGTTQVQAQALAVSNDEPTVAQSLIFPEFLENEKSLTESLNDPVWDLRAAPGRTLIQLPIQIGPVTEATEIKSPAMDVGSSRFVCWRIDPAYSTSHEAEPDEVVETEADELSPMQRADLIMLSGEQIKSIYGEDGPSPAVNIDETGQPTTERRGVRTVLPDEASRLTREITVRPDGSIAWSLERALVGMNIHDGDQPYKLKMRSDRLRDLRPKRPVRPRRNSGEDARTYRQRVHEIEEKYRDAMREYQDLSKAVRELPDEFVVGELDQVYAVFEIANSVRNFKLEGAAPLPWEIPFDTFGDLRTWLKQPPTNSDAQDAELSGEPLRVVDSLSRLLNEQQPLSYEAAAMVLDRMGVVPGVEFESQLYNLLKRIVTGPNQKARLLVVEDLSATLPPTEATASLLAAAAKFMSSAEQWAMLSGMLTADLTDEQSQKMLVETANRVLSDEQGRAVFDVLSALAQKAKSNQTLNAQLIKTFNFSSMPPERFEAMVRFIARYASSSPIVADWLHMRLLRDAQTAEPVLEALWTIHENDRELVLGDWPIRGTNDGLITILLDANYPADGMAWRVLPDFSLTKEARQQAQSSMSDKNRKLAKDATDDEASEGDAPPLDVIQALVDAGLAQATTPRTLVPFLVSQDRSATDPHDPTDLSHRIALALLRLIREADALGKQQAVAVLIGSNRALSKSFSSLSPDEREATLREIWATRGDMTLDETPLVLGMIRHDSAIEPITALLSDPETADPLPGVKAVAKAAGDEQDLLQLTWGDDTPVRRAAVAALVIQNDADETAARRLADQFIAAPDQTDKGLGELWAKAREELVMRTIRESQGRYQLTLKVETFTEDQADDAADQTDDAGDPADAAAEDEPAKVYELGIADLQVEGSSVSFNNGLILAPLVETSQLALEEPSALKIFEIDGLVDVPLEESEKPWKLKRDEQGVWSGGSKLPDDQQVTLIMKPIEMGDDP